MEHLISKLKRAITAADVTATALARRCGVPATCMSGYLSGRREPRLAAIVALARELGLSLDYLLDDAREAEDDGRLTPAQAQAVLVVGVLGLSVEQVIERLYHDPRARPEIVVPEKGLARRGRPPRSA
jgi:transcriptional regulator with XRE-family HTH domain